MTPLLTILWLVAIAWTVAMGITLFFGLLVATLWRLFKRSDDFRSDDLTSSRGLQAP